jgi:hypothetical protein
MKENVGVRVKARVRVRVRVEGMMKYHGGLQSG